MAKLAVLIVLLVGAGIALAIPSIGAGDACAGGKAGQHFTFELAQSNQSEAEIPPANPDPAAVAGWIANQAELVQFEAGIEIPDEFPEPELFGFSSWDEVVEYTLENQTPGGGGVVLPISPGECI
ncbi:MAG: hypothetical protein J4N26_03035 [Chloroflexi bacterium]|nr:hypothetical protein [Chloroflexota bacterium]